MKSAVARVLFFIIYGLLVLAPLFALAGWAGQAAAGSQVDWAVLVFPRGRRLELFANSLLLAGLVTGLTAALGWLAALRWSPHRQAPAALWALLPLAALPPYIHAWSWLALTAQAGSLFQRLGLPVALPPGWSSAVWVETAAYLPLAIVFSWLGLRSIDPELLEASQVHAAGLKSLLQVTLPLARGGLLVGAGLVFLLSLLDYSVPSLFQVNVYPLEIFADYSATNQAGRALLLGLPLLGVTLVVLGALLGPLRRLGLRQPPAGRAPSSPQHLPGWFDRLAWPAGALVAALLLLPPAGLFVTALGGSPLSASRPALAALQYSLACAGAAALLSLPLAVLGARSLDRFRSPAWLVVLAPLAVPAPLVGLGWNLLLAPWGLVSTGQVLGPALAGLARFAPLAILALWAYCQRSDPLLAEAAAVFQPPASRRWLQVSLPLLLPGLLAAAGLVFVLSLGELGATLMVVPPGRETLTLRLYNYLHYGASGSVAFLALLLAGSVYLVGLLAAAGFAWWSRYTLARSEL